MYNDSLRVDGVSLETAGIVEAMTIPGNHCIVEYVIPYRNAISDNAGLRQCSSMSYTQGSASLTLGCTVPCRWHWFQIHLCLFGRCALFVYKSESI